MVPSNARGYWCLYAWDIEERKVHVMDPCSGGVPINEQKKRHEGYISDLQKALMICKKEMFTGWDEDFANYEYIIVKGSYATTKR
jgi:hypothetical protein